jgi:hypothetical protein
VSTSVDVFEFTEKYERGFSLITSPLGSGDLSFGDIEVWFVDSGGSQHMTGMRSVFPSLSKKYS